METGNNIFDYAAESRSIEANIPDFNLKQMLDMLVFLREHPALGIDNILALDSIRLTLETWMYTKYGIPMCFADIMIGNTKKLRICGSGLIYKHSKNPAIYKNIEKIKFMSQYGMLDTSTVTTGRFPLAYAVLLN